MSREILDLIIDDISRKRSELMRTVNSNLLKLCWNIGKLISMDIVAIIDKQDKTIFSDEQLLLMQNFAKLFPDETVVNKLGSYIDWWHLALLIQLPDNKTFNYYFRRIIEKGLSSHQLKREIANVIGNKDSLLMYPFFPEIPVYDHNLAKQIPVEDLFKSKWANNFKQWFISSPLADDERPIAEFQRIQSTFFNKSMNMAMEQWGGFIVKNKKSLSNLSSFLQVTYGKDVFSIDDLNDMSKHSMRSIHERY